VLGHDEVSANPRAAAEMVGFIQVDETPHVEYLRTALSELAARTIRTIDGGTLPGRRVVHGFLHGILEQMTRTRPEEQRGETGDALDDALRGHPSADSIRQEFEGLARPWSPPAQTGFEREPDREP